MRGVLFALGVIFAAVVAPPSTSDAAEDLDAVLTRIQAAYGVVVPAPGTLTRSRGRMLSASRSLGGTILREAVWPDYLRVEIAFDDGTSETRMMLGKDGWRDGAPASGPLVHAMRLQAARLSLPMILWWERETLSDLGPATLEDGRSVRRLRLEIGEGLALFVEIDGGTGQILRSAGVMTMGGAEMAFGTAYSDYREFGGATWPAHEDQSAMGRAIGWTKVESYELGLSFDRDSVQP